MIHLTSDTKFGSTEQSELKVKRDDEFDTTTLMSG